MLPLRLAVPTEIFRMPLKKSILQAAKCGVQGIRVAAYAELKPDELSETGVRQLLHHLRELGLSVAAVNLPLQHRFSNPQHVDGHVARLKLGMQLAAALKSQVMLVQPGLIPAADDAEAWKQLVDILNDVAGFGNHIGVIPTLSIAATQPAVVSQLFAEVTTGQIGLNFDPAAVLAGRLSVSATVRALHNSILHVTARDGIDDGSAQGQETVIGQGDVDWLETVALLGEIGYRDWLTVDRTESEDRLRDIQLGINRLQNLVGSHGF